MHRCVVIKGVGINQRQIIIEVDDDVEKPTHSKVIIGDMSADNNKTKHIIIIKTLLQQSGLQ